MSTPPPFPPANQPFSPPPGIGQPGVGSSGFTPGAGIGQPSWQTGGVGVPSGLTPSPAPSKKSKTPLIIGGLVVVAALVVVGVFVLDGGGDGGGIDSGAAARGLEAVLRDGSYDDTGFQSLRICPLGDIDELTAAVGKVIDIDGAVVDGEIENGLTEESDFPGFVACQIDAADEVRDGPSGLFFQAILNPPRGYEEYIAEFSGDATTLKFDDPVEYEGGEVFLFCGEANDIDGYTGCDADWVNTEDDIALNVFIAGPDLDSDDAFTALQEVIAAMAENLAGFETNES